MIHSLTEIEIAWLAGLFEGEASFGLDTRSIKRYKVSTSPPALFIKIAMVDEDIIKRVSKLVNKNYFSPTRRTVKQKQVYIVHIGDRKTLIELLPKLFPYFGERRKLKVQECIDALDAWQKWYSSGGRQKMAKQGSLSKKFLSSKSIRKEKN